MTTLAANKYPAFEDLAKNDVPVIADDIIYQGAMVGDNASGYARPLQAGDPFLGIADDKADNTGGSAGDKFVRCKEEGVIIEDVVGATGVGDIGSPVYASDDDVLTLTAGSNTLIGRVRRHISGTKCAVYFLADTRKATT